MRTTRVLFLLGVCMLGVFSTLNGQTAASNNGAKSASKGPVPRLMQYSGILKDRSGTPLTGVQGVIFTLYNQQEDGTALWMETQSVTADELGRFSALLGATQHEGLPIELFSSGQAQWLGVHPAGQEQAERIQLASVPYAIALAPQSFASVARSVQPEDPGNSPITDLAVGPGLTGGGSSGDVTVSVIPCPTAGEVLRWDGATWVCSASALVIGGGGNVGVGTSTPGFKLDVNGQVNAANALCIGSDCRTSWAAVAGGDITAVNAGTGLSGGGSSGDVSLSIMPCLDNGAVLKWGGSSWACQADVTGVGGSGAVNFIPKWGSTSSLTNSIMSADATRVFVNGSLEFPDGASMITTFGANRFLYADISKLNFGMGFNVGNPAATGTNNIAIGRQALQENTTGQGNVGIGDTALTSNTTGARNVGLGNSALINNETGGSNTSAGDNALRTNVSGDFNTAVGASALGHSTGSFNTAVGQGAGGGAVALVVDPNANTTGSRNTFLGFRSGVGTPAELTNATALGAEARVSASNALVLGNNVNVGIGIQAPTAKLHVVGGNAHLGTAGSGIILKSPDGGVCRLISIDNSGALVVGPILCP